MVAVLACQTDTSLLGISSPHRVLPAKREDYAASLSLAVTRSVLPRFSSFVFLTQHRIINLFTNY